MPAFGSSSPVRRQRRRVVGKPAGNKSLHSTSSPRSASSIPIRPATAAHCSRDNGSWNPAAVIRSAYFPQDEEEDEFETSSCGNEEGESDTPGLMHDTPLKAMEDAEHEMKRKILAQIRLPKAHHFGNVSRMRKDENQRLHTFPATNDMLWPRGACGGEILTLSSVDVLAPLFLLPLPALGVLHARLRPL